MSKTQYAILASILPNLSDAALRELIETAQFLLVRRHLPAVEMPQPMTTKGEG